MVAGNAGTVGSNWYPGDEWRGDAARIIMYMYLRYGSQCLPSFVTEGSVNTIDSNMINLLLEWNAADPVSTIEDNRNTFHENTTNTYAQGNRNPFIDNPYLATLIWGGPQAENRWGANGPVDTEEPSIPTNLMASNPTPTTVDLAWTASTDNVAVTAYDVYVYGSFYITINSVQSTFTVTGLVPETTYNFSILAKDSAGNTSALSTSVSETTTANPPVGTDCVNENFENIPSNSASYQTRIWTGADGVTDGWTATDARTDQTLNSNSICIRNGTLTSPAIAGGIGELTVTTQLTFSGSAGTFNVLVNGNSVGSIPYSGDNTTPTTTTIPNINIEGNITVVLDNQSASNRVRIDDLSWTCYSSVLGNDSFELNDIKVFPNPVRGNEVTIVSNNSILIEVYDILGKKVKQQYLTSNRKKLNISGLRQGIYVLRLKTDSGTITKKLIKQ